MTYIIPSRETKRHIQDNDGPTSGTIYQSRNIDLDTKGHIKLAEGTCAMYTEDDDSQFRNLDAMYPSEDRVFINGRDVFSTVINFDTITNRSTDTGVPTPSFEEDVVYFNDTEVVSDAGDIYYRSSSTVWTQVSTNLDTSVPLAMTVWEGENSLVAGAGNTVKFVNTSWAINGTVLTLPNEYIITSMCSIGSRLFIATRSKSGGEAKMFIVNAIATSADLMYGAGAISIFSLKPFKSTVVCVVSTGELLRFTGGGFEQLAKFPVFNDNIEWTSPSSPRVTNRSMAVDGDLIYINLDSITDDNIAKSLVGFPSGVWCYDSSLGALYHRYSPSFSKTQRVDGLDVTVDTSDNDFTLTSGNLDNVTTGMPVIFDEGSVPAIPDIVEGEVYYIIKDSSTIFRLATTYANAIAGTGVDITGAGNTSQAFIIVLTNDYGWTLTNSSRMSLAVLNTNLYDSSLAGRIIMTSNLGAKQGILTDKASLSIINRNLPNRGYFITPKLEASSVTDMYTSLYLRYKELYNDDSIVVKYKTRDYEDLPLSSATFVQTDNWIGTWVDTDTFTCTTDLSNVQEGDEIEITAGVGSGHIAHVSSISESTGTYTVNLDEAFPFAASGDECYFQTDRWIKLKTITPTSEEDEGFAHMRITKSSKFIQFKIELRGVGVTIEELLVDNKPHETAV